MSIISLTLLPNTPARRTIHFSVECSYDELSQHFRDTYSKDKALIFMHAFGVNTPYNGYKQNPHMYILTQAERERLDAVLCNYEGGLGILARYFRRYESADYGVVYRLGGLSLSPQEILETLVSLQLEIVETVVGMHLGFVIVDDAHHINGWV